MTFASFALGDLRFGFSICYDLRFPEMYRKLATEQNVGAFLISSAWPFPRDEHFRVLAQARAIENQSYVIASNRVGKDDDLWFCGNSAIIDPRGVVIAAASPDREELIHADVSEELVQSVRRRVNSLGHRRRRFIRLGNRGTAAEIRVIEVCREPLRRVSRQPKRLSCGLVIYLRWRLSHPRIDQQKDAFHGVCPCPQTRHFHRHRRTSDHKCRRSYSCRR